MLTEKRLATYNYSLILQNSSFRMNFVTLKIQKKQNSATYKTNKGKIQRIRSSPRGLSQHLGLPTDRFYVPTLPHTQLLHCILLLDQYCIRKSQLISTRILQAYIYTAKCSLRSSNNRS